jgi:hypothetical protein
MMPITLRSNVRSASREGAHSNGLASMNVLYQPLYNSQVPPVCTSIADMASPREEYGPELTPSKMESASATIENSLPSCLRNPIFVEPCLSAISHPPSAPVGKRHVSTMMTSLLTSTL